MAQLKEIFERESQRGTAESSMVIHFFHEGTFYRAYEWSAWLCVRYINGFKVTKRELKSQEESMRAWCSSGCPLKCVLLPCYF